MKGALNTQKLFVSVNNREMVDIGYSAFQNLILALPKQSCCLLFMFPGKKNKKLVLTSFSISV